MTGEKLRKQGIVQVAVGVVLVAWVVVFAATAEVGNPAVLLAAAATAGIVCLAALASGVVATRVVDVASAVRLRHVFVVLEGVVLAVFYPFFWSGFSLETPGPDGDLAVGAVLVLSVPVIVAIGLAFRTSWAVHKIVTEVNGPIVPDDGVGAPLQRIRVLGTILVVVGSVLALAVVPVTLSLSTPVARGFFLVHAVLIALVPVVLGVKLTRVTDVYSVRRLNVQMWPVVVGPLGLMPATAYDKVSSMGSAALLSALMFGVIVLMVIAMLMVREYAGEFDRPWRERLWGRGSGVSR